MHSAAVLAAALALATPALASPAGVAGAFDVGARIGPVGFEVAGAAELDLSLCHPKAAAAFGVKVDISACKFHMPNFRERMNTPAHRRYEEALEIYHDVMHLVRHTLMTRGVERALRLIEIASLIRDGEAILIVAAELSLSDDHFVRRRWVQHEIHALEAKFKKARFWACHLPNLYLAEDFFHFVIDASVKVVEFAVAVPIAVGAAVGLAIHESIHLVAKAFHFMGHVLKWAVEEIVDAFIVLARKIKKGIKKIGHGIKKIGHEIKEGIIAIGHGIHHVGHEIKEGLEDGISIIVDIGHHALHRHHCHHKCNANVGIIVVDDSSSSSEDQCDCAEEESSSEDYVDVAAVCVEKEQVCTKETFTAKVQAEYNIELSWTKEESHEKVKATIIEINQAVSAFTADLKKLERDASADRLED